MIEPRELSEADQSQVTNISQAEVQSIHADLVRMHQASADTINADEVELEQSAAANVKANHISMHQSAMARVEAGEVLSQNSAMGFVQAQKASVSGYTGAVVAESADVHHGMAVFVAGREVRVQDARTILLVGQNVNGNVTTLMDSRSALIAGLVGGLFAGLMLLLGRMLFGRD
ncbi:MAG TPA: hypothetical protein VGA72_17070 [Anaerolineales bacterium]